ncbi:aminotransferase [Virgisporangium aliadipatigenens]|uniref:Aminotransferase n=1 Tax=Virgisporangium aliadipatigenens TaxID=741659 RepID=A0A8J3YUZ9_9ACTN|nr:aminotransferase [Virgisporangium aliadipatigenens]
MHDALRFHGDREVAAGLVDLAVNVRSAPMPEWLAAPIAASLTELAAYPDDTAAKEALAARHGRTPDEILLTAGAAQAFTMVAFGLAIAKAAVVHPQFTEPEAALRAAGVPVERVLLEEPHFALDPRAVPADADLVVLGNPTNPTSVLHRAETIAALARPGRALLVDEAFADTVPGEPESLVRNRNLPGLMVTRSLTKTWGLAGLRIGYLVAAPELIARVSSAAPLWPVSTPALAAAVACASPLAVAAEREIAERLAADRAHLVHGLAAVPGCVVAGPPASSFVLVRVADGTRIREALRSGGWAVRRGDTFPGLGGDWLRIAVRDPATSDAFLKALAREVGET